MSLEHFRRKKRCSDDERTRARQTDIREYLATHGWVIHRDGQRHWRARRGDDELRLTLRSGTWLWCDKHGVAGGDPIDLVMHIRRCSYNDAVAELLGYTPRMHSPCEPCEPTAPVVIPKATATDVERGRKYLFRRFINTTVIEYAERQGFLKYAQDAVLFVGYDGDGRVRCATRRAIDPADPVQKRDLRHSNKKYAPVLLPEHNTHEISIVEGGVDALALWTLAKRRNFPPPAVIVSGGAGVLGFFETRRALIERADVVIIACDNEANPDTQKRTDALHEKQAARARAIAPSARVELWWPPPGIKDIADLLEKEMSGPPTTDDRTGHDV